MLLSLKLYFIRMALLFPTKVTLFYSVHKVACLSTEPQQVVLKRIIGYSEYLFEIVIFESFETIQIFVSF